MFNKIFSVFSLLIITLVSFNVLAGINSAKLNPGKAPADWWFAEGDYAPNLWAPEFFENFQSTYAHEVNATLKNKEKQSIATPKARGNVYYMEFDDNADMKAITNFANEIVFEGASSTKDADTSVFAKGNVLVIISSETPALTKRLESLIQK